jgi:putative restriction endonuclease
VVGNKKQHKASRCLSGGDLIREDDMANSVNQEERAFFAWIKLTEIAKKKITCTYKELGDAIDIHHRTVTYPLELIQRYCSNNSLPPLTILVINSSTGKPSSGFYAAPVAKFAVKTKEVQEFNWDGVENPFGFANEGFTRDSVIDETINSGKIPEKVWRFLTERGMDQAIFRKVLLKIYEGKCCICNLSIPELLEAAHIIPYSDCAGEQKMSINNGLLLCANHHELFDHGIIEISKDYKILLKNVVLNGSEDKDFVGKYEGRRINLPKNIAHYPDKNLLG